MNRKSGIILGIALIVFLVISILGAALMTIVMGQAKQANDLEKRTQAYFLARSGVEIAREYVDKIDKDALENKILVLYGNLRDDDDYSYDFNIRDVTNIWSNDVRASFEASSSSFRNYEVVTAIWKDDDFTNFISSGNAGDMSRTVAFKCIEASEGIPVFDMAIFANEKISIGSATANKGNITGNVGTNSTDISAISANNSKKDLNIDGKVFFGLGTNLEKIDPKHYSTIPYVGTLESTRDYASLLPGFPDFEKVKEDEGLGISKSDPKDSEIWTITQDGYYEKITVSSNKTLTIYTGSAGTVRKIVVDVLEFGSNSSIELSGEGKLNLYVGSFSSKGDSSVGINKKGNEKEIDRVVVYYGGNSLKNVDLDLTGTIFIEGAGDITLGQGNKELNISGLIIYRGDKNITISGTPKISTIALFAPNADVEFKGTSDFYGAIVCKKFIGSGAGTVEYKNVYAEFSETSLEIIDGDGDEAIELWGE